MAFEAFSNIIAYKDEIENDVLEKRIKTNIKMNLFKMLAEEFKEKDQITGNIFISIQVLNEVETMKPYLNNDTILLQGRLIYKEV